MTLRVKFNLHRINNLEKKIRYLCQQGNIPIHPVKAFNGGLLRHSLTDPTYQGISQLQFQH
jgi:hypothetical protein